MIKEFCDGCGQEIIGTYNYASHRYKRRLTILPPTSQKTAQIIIEVHVAVDGTWNSGHVCGECLKKVFLEGEETG